MPIGSPREQLVLELTEAYHNELFMKYLTLFGVGTKADELWRDYIGLLSMPHSSSQELLDPILSEKNSKSNPAIRTRALALAIGPDAQLWPDLLNSAFNEGQLRSIQNSSDGEFWSNSGPDYSKIGLNVEQWELLYDWTLVTSPILQKHINSRPNPSFNLTRALANCRHIFSDLSKRWTGTDNEVRIIKAYDICRFHPYERIVPNKIERESHYNFKWNIISLFMDKSTPEEIRAKIWRQLEAAILPPSQAGLEVLRPLLHEIICGGDNLQEVSLTRLMDLQDEYLKLYEYKKAAGWTLEDGVKMAENMLKKGKVELSQRIARVSYMLLERTGLSRFDYKRLTRLAELLENNREKPGMVDHIQKIIDRIADEETQSNEQRARFVKAKKNLLNEMGFHDVR